MKTVIIGCGGFGVKRLGDINKRIDTMGNAEIMAIDGSASDLAVANLPEEVVNLVEDTDGAGKKRAINAKEYCAWVDANMQKVPAGTMYIIMYSMTGGSGSVIGPHLSMRLTERGENVINVGVITGRSTLDAKNTVNTLNGLGSYVNHLKKPLFISLMEQDGQPASAVDLATVANVAEFSRITAYKYDGLDSEDVRSFFDYGPHGAIPQLTEITHFGGNDESEIEETMRGRCITQLSLVCSQDSPIPEMMSLFDCHGIDAEGSEKDDTHFVCSTQSMMALAKRVNDRHAAFVDANKALQTSAVFGEGSTEMAY